MDYPFALCIFYGECPLVRQGLNARPTRPECRLLLLIFDVGRLHHLGFHNLCNLMSSGYQGLVNINTDGQRERHMWLDNQ